MPGNERASNAPDLSVPAPLAAGEIEVLGALPESSNAALLVRCVTPDDSVLAVYKPMRGEAPLWDFPDGTLHRREVAAFEVARALGWPRVPPTVLRDGPFGPGSMQRFISFDPAEHFFTLEVEHADTFRRVAMFDLAVNNADRKGGHIIPMPSGHVYGVDHGICFSVDPKLRTLLWRWAGKPLTAEALEVLERLGDDLRGELGEELHEHLTRREVRTTQQRVSELLRTRRHPEPSGEWPALPWPPF